MPIIHDTVYGSRSEYLRDGSLADNGGLIVLITPHRPHTSYTEIMALGTYKHTRLHVHECTYILLHIYFNKKIVEDFTVGVQSTWTTQRLVCAT